MNLIKNKLYTYVKQYQDCDLRFQSFDRSKDSYYINYSDSVHLHGILNKFEGMELCDVRKSLEDLWRDEDCKDVIPFILAGFYKAYFADEGSALSDMDLYNYMM